MLAVNIPQSTKFDEFDAIDITEEDIDQFERRRARIGRPLIQGTAILRRPLPLTHSTYPLSSSEELVNSITHGIGLTLSIIGAVVMTLALGRGDVWRVAGCGVYLFSLIIVYAMSTMMHSCHSPRRKSFFRALDQGSIYLLVAATYTPFSLAYLRTGVWWILLGLIWAIALQGFLAKVLFAYRVEAPAIWPHVLIGGIPFISIPTLLGVISISALWWILVGVACYVVGLVFFVNDERVRHFHAVWHVCVVAGSMCHFMGIYLFVVRV
jgi:hemolysin III